jgi:hypothetical protein
LWSNFSTALEAFYSQEELLAMPRPCRPRAVPETHFSVRNNSFLRQALAATNLFVSQFKQHIRAVAGWPLAKPVRHGQMEMTNLIAAEVGTGTRWPNIPGAAVRLYGKKDARLGRKMGMSQGFLENNRDPGADGLSTPFLLHARPIASPRA